MRIYAQPADKGACGNYRIVQPLEALAGDDYSVGFTEGTFVDEEEKLEFLEETDAFVFQRPRRESQSAFFERFQHHPDKLLVFEHDDNSWDLHPLSDHFRWHGTTDIAMPIKKLCQETGLTEKEIISQAKEDGKTVKDGMVWLWEHGKNGYNVIENQQKISNFEQCLAKSDLITCTTPRLGKLFKKMASKLGNKKATVYDFPNCLDLRKWIPVEIKHDGVRILWQGGASHQPDLKVVQEALEIICQKFPEVTIVFGGVNFPGITKNINPKQVEVYDNWTEYSAHPYRMALFAADINIVPIQDTYFNSFKSDIKATEAMALCVPTVASSLTPYKDTIENGVTGLLANNTTESWVKNLTKLIEDASFRKNLGQAGRKWVEKNRDVIKEAPKLGRAYQRALKRKKKTCLPQTSSPESKRDSTTQPDRTTTLPPLLPRYSLRQQK